MIQNTLAALKEMSEQPQRCYFGEGGWEEFQPELQPGISSDECSRLTAALPFSLPEEYLEFLKISNGVYFSPTETSLYSLKDCVAFTKENDFAPGIFMFGYTCSTTLVMNCNELDTGKYIYAGTDTAYNEFLPLLTDFTGFLDNLLHFNAGLYWDWANYGEIRYHDFRRPED